MRDMRNIWRGAAAAAGALIIAFAASSAATDILNDWDTVKPPPKPEIKAVTLEPSTTALLILDMMKQNCGARPRCVATVPNVKRLHDAARAARAVRWSSADTHHSRAGEWRFGRRRLSRELWTSSEGSPSPPSG